MNDRVAATRPSGAAVRADMRLNIGREYVLRLEIEGRMVSVKGLVVWSTLSGIGRSERGESASQYSAGLKFKDVLTDQLEQVLGFIDSNKVNPEKRLVGLRFRVHAPGKATINTTQTYEVLLISLSGMLIRTDQDLLIEGLHPMEITPAGEPAIRFTGRVASSVAAHRTGAARAAQRRPGPHRPEEAVLRWHGRGRDGPGSRC